MSDVRAKFVSPSITETAFNCPHCGALAKQFWYSVLTDQLKTNTTPRRVDGEELKTLTFDDIEDIGQRKELRRWATGMAGGRPFLIENREYGDNALWNVSLSQCFNCDDIAIWIHNNLVWPVQGTAPLPNVDLPAEIAVDYLEASAILNSSPRGAAALLRLCIQKLCMHLRQKGESLNDDIAALVQSGLDQKIQKALDIVRVIGNNAVHPGQIDLKDDAATASKLFALVNLIAERMISETKHIDEFYKTLPPGALAAIESRDKK